jgi:bifunctional DNA-binding transcriptional regulator/antitoxin component of YhaV-PrlF toxin-antitoxin module
MRKKISDIKIIKAVRHNYSIRFFLPKNFCRFLGINDESFLECYLDRKNKRIIIRKKDKKNEC